MKKIKLHLKETVAGEWYWYVAGKNGKIVDGSIESYSRRMKAIEGFNTATRLRFELFEIPVSPGIIRSGYDFYRFLKDDQIVVTRPSSAEKKLQRKLLEQ